jgi:hypothetical protein
MPIDALHHLCDELQEASAVERPRHARSKKMAIWSCLQQVCIESHAVKVAGQTYGAPHPLLSTPPGVEGGKVRRDGRGGGRLRASRPQGGVVEPRRSDAQRREFWDLLDVLM